MERYTQDPKASPVIDQEAVYTCCFQERERRIKEECELELSKKDDEMKKSNDLIERLREVIAKQQQEISRKEAEMERERQMKEDYKLELSKKDEEIGEINGLFAQLQELMEKQELEISLKEAELKSLRRFSQCSSGYCSRNTSFSQVGEGSRPLSVMSTDSLPEGYISDLGQHMPCKQASRASIGIGRTLVPVNGEGKSVGLEKGRSNGRRDADRDDPHILDD